MVGRVDFVGCGKGELFFSNFIIPVWCILNLGQGLEYDTICGEVKVFCARPRSRFVALDRCGMIPGLRVAYCDNLPTQRHTITYLLSSSANINGSEFWYCKVETDTHRLLQALAFTAGIQSLNLFQALPLVPPPERQAVAYLEPRERSSSLIG